MHWGDDLGPFDDGPLAALSAVESRSTLAQTVGSALRVPLVPQESDGWAGRPGLSARRDGLQVFPHWTTVGVTGGDASSPRQLALDLEDARSGLALRLGLATGQNGLVSLRSTLEALPGRASAGSASAGPHRDLVHPAYAAPLAGHRPAAPWGRRRRQIRQTKLLTAISCQVLLIPYSSLARPLLVLELWASRVLGIGTRSPLT
jgi:hypothetical protein